MTVIPCRALLAGSAAVSLPRIAIAPALRWPGPASFDVDLSPRAFA